MTTSLIYAEKLAKYKLDSLKECAIHAITESESKLPSDASKCDHDQLRSIIQKSESYYFLLHYLHRHTFGNRRTTSYGKLCNEVNTFLHYVQQRGEEIEDSNYKKQIEKTSLPKLDLHKSE